jgi:hypothetical protein
MIPGKKAPNSMGGKMPKKAILIIFGLMAAYFVGFFLESQNPVKIFVKKEFYESLADFKQKAKQNVDNFASEQKVTLSQTLGVEGTTDNFEGPKVTIDAIKFYNKTYSTTREPEFTNDHTSASFNPDHPYYGLPRVKFWLSPVKLQNSLSFFNREPKPYLVYKKPYTKAGKERIMEIQLWLTEFNFTIHVSATAGSPPVPVTDEEREHIQYPGSWYSRPAGTFVKLGELRREESNNRYGSLTAIIKIAPNKNPFYVKNMGADAIEEKKPEFAVAAVYCSGLETIKESENRLDLNVCKGNVVYLNTEGEIDNEIRSDARAEYLTSLTQNIAETKMKGDDQGRSIFGRDYYIKIRSKNIGTWMKRKFIGSKEVWGDKVDFSFIMPIFVIGDWVVKTPSEIIPKWDPPAAYHTKVNLLSFLPSFKLGIIGRVISAGIIVFFVLIILSVFSPLAGGIMKKILGL